ncbi:STAS domain-containing protein [Sagittula stellata]|uniref:Anti-sigma factor antagonist n=1 Tax=Sagittula stellata (strain ATCC 700073 / DSM 11524 / E-37) TaxID=388399 RepID=A3K3U1_SAGS3|nr:STAS domain-containing protein [Sagittula stellata]EBA08205.1 Antisigma-factor antagonist (STAS) domain protein [Sagittula stellata E-37]
MQLSTTSDNGVAIIRVDADRIDAAVAIAFKDRMREILGDASGRVVLDLERVDFIDSSGLGAIVAAMKLMPPNAKLELAGLSPAVDKVFRMTRMDSIFQIHETAVTALNA